MPALGKPGAGFSGEMTPQNLINFGPTDNRPPVRVRSLRDMIARPLGCGPRPVAVGEEFTIEAAMLDQLGTEDIEVLGPVEILSVSEIEATDMADLEAGEHVEAAQI